MSEGLQRVRRQRSARKTKRSRPNRLLGAVVFGAVLIAIVGCGFGIREIVRWPLLRVREIAVRGNRRIATEEIGRLLESSRGKAVLQLDIDALRKRVEALPGVAQAEVLRRLPDLLLVTIEERHALAATRIGKRALLVDDEGRLFPPGRGRPQDERLPRLTSLATGGGAVVLSAKDRPAIDALVAYQRATGGLPPGETRIDLTYEDRIIFQRGENAPTLLLDRKDPALNLEELIALEDRVTRLASGRAIDLRFPHRLTLVPLSGAGARR